MNSTVSKRTVRPNAPSMHDVAKAAGVSQTTVSFVVNNAPGADNISAETHERVWEAIKELGYRPNAIARGLRSKRTQTIGLISDNIATTPYAGCMIQGAQDVAWEQGKLILLVNTGGDAQIENAAVDMLLERQVEGIIYATFYHRQVTPSEAIKEVPSVLLDCYASDGSLPSVVPDEVAAAKKAVEYLISKGHTRIGYLSNQDPIPATSGRLRGYRDILTAYNIPFDETLVWTGPSTTTGGFSGALALLQRPNRPTALFCFNDRMAMGAYQAAAELKLSIPKDVAVIGFDNQEIIAEALRPPLTTLKLPHYEMGQRVLEHLLALIESQEEESAPMHHAMHCPLIERSSA